MAKVYLEHWQCLEIFSMIISKMESEEDQDIHLSDFHDPSFLNKKLKKYDSKTLCSSVSKKIFGNKKDSNNNTVPVYPAGFYEFGRKIRLGEPVIVDEEMLDAMLDFINENLLRSSSDRYKVEHRRYIVPWLPSKKQSKLQGSSWWLYFYDRKYYEDGKYTDGLTKALVTFYPFGRVEIKSFSTNLEGFEEYIGTYDMYGKDEKYMLLQLKLKRTGEKDLHILFYIGTGEITLALGQFHNVGRSIYSGTVILEKIETALVTTGDIRFYKTEEQNKNNVPEYVSEYFAERKRNLMRTPSSITNKIEFKRWLWSKNRPEKSQ